MKRTWALFLVMVALTAIFITSNCLAKEVTLSGVPDEISNATVLEWASVLIERIENQKLMPPEDKVLDAEVRIDKFRTDNGLPTKYEK